MLIDLLRKFEHAVFDERMSHFQPQGFQIGEGHAAADDNLVHLFTEVLNDTDLSGDFGPPQNRHERPHGVGDRAFQIFDFLSHEKPRARLRQKLGDAGD